MLLVCNAGEKYFAPTLIGGVGADWHGCEQVCGIAGCDSGEKYFAPTLIGGVGAYGLGCEQGARCLWFAIRAKNISPLHWLVVGQTNRVANRYAVLLVAIGAKKILAAHWVAHLAVVR